MTSPETWTVQQCADEWGVRPSTWRDYVAKGYAPKPLPGYDEQRRRIWNAEEVRSWPRKGQGARSDLQQPASGSDG